MALDGMKTIYATGAGGKQYKPYSVANDAPLTQYSVPGHNLNTWSIKDTGGQSWYLTDGGNWRNATTKALQTAMPSYAPPTPTPTPAPAPVNTAPTPATPESTYKSIWDFQRNDAPLYQGTNPIQPMKSFQEYLPQNYEASPTFKWAMQQSDDAVTKSLAAKGLLGSGAEDVARNDARMKVLTPEVDKQYDAASQSFNAANNERTNMRNLLAGIYQGDFSQYWQNVNNERDRELTKDSQNLGATATALDFLKSLNLMQYAASATNSAADNEIALGKLLAQLAGSGGGGGGGSSGGGQSAVSNLPASAGSTFNPTNYFVSAAANILPGLINAFTR